MQTSSSLQPSKANRVLILHNPKAGARDTFDKVQRLAQLLEKHGFKVEISTDLDHVTRLANELAEDGSLRVLVGVGGDGTAAELVNRTKEGTPITLLPAGNENLLARHLFLSSMPETLAETIAYGTTIRLDAGRAAGRIFLLMASCGLDAEVVRRVHECRTGHLSSRNYFKPLWIALRTYEYPELRVYCDEALDGGGDAAYLTARWISVFNLPCYGGALRFAPLAIGNDGRLDLCGFRRGKFWSFLGYIAAVYLRRHRRMANWFLQSVRRVRIESDIPVPYQLDGDPAGWLPLDIEVLPNRLTILVPKEHDA